MGIRRSPLALALAVQAALWLTTLGALPVWGDEQFTLNTIALGWSEIPGALRRDIHPPLYYFLAKAWMALRPAGSEIIWLRAFSALTALGTTAAFDFFWLRGRAARGWTLALLAVSPALLLYARMGRSYGLQALLAVVALGLAWRVLGDSPRRDCPRKLGLALAALLYTHYLPGVAVLGAVLLAGLWRSAAVGLALYLPWAWVLAEGLVRAAGKDVYELVGGPVEHVLRLGMTLVGFTGGEAFAAWTVIPAIGLAAAAGVAALFGAWRLRREARLVAPAAAAGYVGAASWVSFVFMPGRLLFLLPFFVWLAVEGFARRRWVLGAWLALSVLGVGFTVAERGYVNPGYRVDYGAIAARIEAESAPDGTLVVVDAFNGDPKPLLAALDPAYEVIVADSAGFVERVLERDAETIWRLRSARDVSPGRLQERLGRRLAEAYDPESEGLLPVSEWRRRLASLLAGQKVGPTYFLVERWTRRSGGTGTIRGL